MTERGEIGASLTSPWQRIEGGPIRDPLDQRLESLGFSAVDNENGECQSRILSPLRLPFRHPGYQKNRPGEVVRTITSLVGHGQTRTDSPCFAPEVGSTT